MKNKNIKKRIIIILFLFIILTSNILSATMCNINETEEVVKKALYNYLPNPEASELNVTEIKDLLNFYLNSTNLTATKCDIRATLSNVNYDIIINKFLNSTENITIPYCKDGTHYGKCSTTKSKYCFAGELVSRCRVCGCFSGYECQINETAGFTINEGKWGKCVPITENITCKNDADCPPIFGPYTYCKDNNVYEAYSNYTCMNPGTLNSYCKNTSTFSLFIEFKCDITKNEYCFWGFDKCQLACSDKTRFGNCSSTKPLYCSNGILINNCSSCGCPEGKVCLENKSCIIPTCEDGTVYGQCSSIKPLYCDNGELVNNSIKCGCPSNYVHRPDGSCVKSNNSFHYTYVDDDYTGFESEFGTTKFAFIQDAIDNTIENGTVYVNAGTYYENIVIKDGVSLIGEDARSTIIDGQNKGRVITAMNTKIAGTKIKGFTIMNGKAIGSTSGGGISFEGSTYVEISYNIIKNNRAEGMLGSGGGIYVQPLAGGVATVNVTNNVIVNNYAQYTGGGYFEGTDPNHKMIFKNNIIANNSAAYVGGAWLSGKQALYCDFYGNVGRVAYADHTPDGYSSTSIYKNPLFVNSTNNNYYLQANSPCINTGDPLDPVPSGVSSRIDIGAFEFIGEKWSCLDGTNGNQCSVVKPLYCENRTLINNCVFCGCPTEKTCYTNQNCLEKRCIDFESSLDPLLDIIFEPGTIKNGVWDPGRDYLEIHFKFPILRAKLDVLNLQFGGIYSGSATLYAYDSNNNLLTSTKIVATNSSRAPIEISSNTGIYRLYLSMSYSMAALIDNFCFEFSEEQCSDGTNYSQCSAVKPLYCSNGNLVINCQECGCSEGLECLSNESCALACSDQTLYGICSNNKPKYCNNGNLIEKCRICGCSVGEQCEINGSCTTISLLEENFSIPSCSADCPGKNLGDLYYNSVITEQLCFLTGGKSEFRNIWAGSTGKVTFKLLDKPGEYNKYNLSVYDPWGKCSMSPLASCENCDEISIDVIGGSYYVVKVYAKSGVSGSLKLKTCMGGSRYGLPIGSPWPRCGCSDGTIYTACSSTKPFYCNSSGNLANNCQLCGCSSGQICLANGSCITPICFDNTPNGQCSKTKPIYCSNGNLINNCSSCGCPIGLECLYNQSCITSQKISNLSDGSTEKNIIFNEIGNQIIYVEIPPEIKVISATIDITSNVINVNLDVGNDGDIQFIIDETNKTETTPDLSSEINEYIINGNNPAQNQTSNITGGVIYADSGNILVPLTFYSDSVGTVKISNININYIGGQSLIEESSLLEKIWKPLILVVILGIIILIVYLQKNKKKKRSRK